MNFARILETLQICLPVFGVIGLGKLLQARGILQETHRDFINWLVFHISLPALIFAAIAVQDFLSFLGTSVQAMMVSALVPIAIMIGLFALLGKILGYKGGFAAAFIAGTFFANVTYLGFPLSRSAFGEEGFAQAAMYNAVAMPFFVMAAYALIGAFGVHRAGGWTQGVKRALLNPVVIAAFCGVVISLIAGIWRQDSVLKLPEGIAQPVRLIGGFLHLIGEMGLPLALLMIGSALSWHGVSQHLGALIAVVIAKCAVLPLIMLGFFAWLYPDALHEVRGVTVLLGATPAAVAYYVISRQNGVAEDFVSAVVVLTTIVSIVTIPVWVYVLL